MKWVFALFSSSLIAIIHHFIFPTSVSCFCFSFTPPTVTLHLQFILRLYGDPPSIDVSFLHATPECIPLRARLLQSCKSVFIIPFIQLSIPTSFAWTSFKFHILRYRTYIFFVLMFVMPNLIMPTTSRSTPDPRISIIDSSSPTTHRRPFARG